jgi:hypothetical protein
MEVDEQASNSRAPRIFENVEQFATCITACLAERRCGRMDRIELGLNHSNPDISQRVRWAGHQDIQETKYRLVEENLAFRGELRLWKLKRGLKHTCWLDDCREFGKFRSGPKIRIGYTVNANRIFQLQ